MPLAWRTLATPFTPDPLTFGYRWNDELTRTKTANGSVVKLPEYFHLTADANQKPEWTRSHRNRPRDEAPSLSFDRPSERVAEPYTTPEEPDSCWKKPGPVAGPFRARWRRQRGQYYGIVLPINLRCSMRVSPKTIASSSRSSREVHRTSPKDRDYLAPPTVGTLCDLDPALLVTPPKGKEVGYVPIATRQE